MTHPHTRIPVTAAIRVRYALLGLGVGAIWLWQSGTSPWIHGLRILILLIVVPAVAGRLARMIGRRRGRDVRGGLSLGRLVAFKAALALVAVAATVLLAGRVPGLDWYVAAWLALMIAFVGPAAHHTLLSRKPPQLPQTAKESS